MVINTWRAGQVILKPADSVQAGRWFADVYDALAGPGFRVPRPVRALTGDCPAVGQLAGQVRRRLAALRPVDLPKQLIHADLAGNVLFADGMPPAVIDFSPLERPAGLPPLDVEPQGEGGLRRGPGEPVLIAEAPDGGSGGEEFGGVLAPDVVADLDVHPDDARGPRLRCLHLHPGERERPGLVDALGEGMNQFLGKSSADPDNFPRAGSV
ncbi:MAG: phosphotransferase [Trebonia sp.]